MACGLQPLNEAKRVAGRLAPSSDWQALQPGRPCRQPCGLAGDLRLCKLEVLQVHVHRAFCSAQTCTLTQHTSVLLHSFWHRAAAAYCSQQERAQLQPSWSCGWACSRAYCYTAIVVHGW